MPYNDKKIKIIFAIHSPGMGGVQTLLRDWIVNLDTNLFSPKVIFMHGSGGLMPLFDKANIETMTISRSKWNPLIPIKLINAIRKEKSDVLVVQQEVMAILGSFAGWLTNVPAVLVKVPYTKSQVSSLVYRSLRIADKFSHGFLSQSPVCTNELLSIGIPPEKIYSIPSGANIPKRVSSEELQTLRIELGLDPNDLVLFSAARLHKQKGHSILLDAFKKIVTYVPNAKLLIAGAGPEEENLKLKSNSLMLGSSVKFLGYRSDVEKLLSTVHINLLPSLAEGLGIATIQALGMGIPVVAFDVGAVGDGVIHNRTGKLVELGNTESFADAVIELLQNPQMRTELGKNARKHVEKKYSIANSVMAMERIFLSLVEADLNNSHDSAINTPAENLQLTEINRL